MGVLVNGVWKVEWYDTKSTGGRFVRWESRYRNWITPNGSPGPTGQGGFAAEAGRYHLYVSFACPWAHRTLIMRALKGLENAISLSVTHWHMGENGRTFDSAPGVIPDPIHRANYLYQIYLADDPNASGRATTQESYEESASAVFAMLDKLEQRLALARYLFGERPVETDWRLFTTLVRFGAVYFGHFKCNLRRLVDYPNLWGYTRDLFQLPGIAPTVNFDHIRRHYYTSHKTINPTGIVPIGPELDFLRRSA